MTITTGLELVDPGYYGKNGPPHEIWRQLRKDAPVHWCEVEKIEHFWAVTRHEDIRFISRQPEIFLSEPGITPLPTDRDVDRDDGIGAMKVVINTDPPEHRALRKVASPWFTPRALQKMEASIVASAKGLVDALAEAGDETVVDLAQGMAVSHPLRILASALGVPQEQEPKILELSNRLFAPDDEELGGGGTPEAFAKLGQEFLELFLPIIQDRRANPRDDLASLLANGQIDGQAMGPAETLGYYLIVFNAGHDTTKNALAGGLHALIEHPDEFAKLQADESKSAGAVEEILRWTSPVNYMKRTAARDTVLAGQKIREGEALMMFYGSANRDERVFSDPYTFDIERSPNPHIAFGHGEHFCMGSHLARRSQRALIEELARRVEHWELAGAPEWISGSFVIGLKHLPIRAKVRA